MPRPREGRWAPAQGHGRACRWRWMPSRRPPLFAVPAGSLQTPRASTHPLREARVRAPTTVGCGPQAAEQGFAFTGLLELAEPAGPASGFGGRAAGLAGSRGAPSRAVAARPDGPQHSQGVSVAGLRQGRGLSEGFRLTSRRSGAQSAGPAVQVQPPPTAARVCAVSTPVLLRRPWARRHPVPCSPTGGEQRHRGRRSIGAPREAAALREAGRRPHTPRDLRSDHLGPGRSRRRELSGDVRPAHRRGGAGGLRFKCIWVRFQPTTPGRKAGSPERATLLR